MRPLVLDTVSDRCARAYVLRHVGGERGHRVGPRKRLFLRPDTASGHTLPHTLPLAPDPRARSNAKHLCTVIRFDFACGFSQVQAVRQLRESSLTDVRSAVEEEDCPSLEVGFNGLT
eukprot:2730112-Rhodomonas_salina.6